MREVLRSLSSPHVIITFIMFFGNGLTVYAQALFLPSVVNRLGFSATRTQLISVGPFAVAFFGESYHLIRAPHCLASPFGEMDRSIVIWRIPFRPLSFSRNTCHDLWHAFCRRVLDILSRG